jgi:hypothetical protein
MERDNIFLTETRREVLAGESDLSGKSLANEKSRIRTRARAALGELIEVAQSEEIENRNIFEPAQVGLLLGLLIDDPAVMPPGGLTDSPSDLSVPERHVEYRNDVHSEATSTMLALKPPQRGTE